VEEERIRPYVPTVSYWLLGTNPDRRSFADLERQFSTRWSGVTDYVAQKYVHDFDAGDEAIVCELGDEMMIVGVVRVTSDAYPDPQQDDPALMAFDVETVGRLEQPVRLGDVADHPDLRDLDPENLEELWVVPIPAQVWERVLELGRGIVGAEVEGGEGEEAGPEGQARRPATGVEEPRGEGDRDREGALVGEERR
jgi:predicted RNA-binding protein with PUA-like domain